MCAATAADLHHRAQRDSERGRNDSAYRWLHRALDRDHDPALQAHILISLSYHEAEHRRLEDGIALLDRADAVPGLPPRLRSLAASQRGLLYQRAGLLTEAAQWFDRAI